MLSASNQPPAPAMRRFLGNLRALPQQFKASLVRSGTPNPDRSR